MNCVNCGQLNEDGQFCVKCGAKMSTQSEIASTTTTTTSEPVSPPGVPSRSAESAVYVENAKTIGLAYGLYVRRLFKKPTVISEQIDKSNLVNGIISLILFLLAVPFTYFFVYIRHLYSPLFLSMVVKPIFFFSVFLLIVALVIYVYARLCKSKATFKDVVARFGAFLTIPAALQWVAAVAAIIQLTSITFFISSLAMWGLVAAICLTIYSYGKDQEEGIDAFYGIMLTILIMGLFSRMVSFEDIQTFAYTFTFGSGMS